MPEDDARDGLDRLGSPARAGAAAVVAVIVAVVVVVLCVRAILARPTVWFVLLGIALPIRIPVSLGSQEGNLLVPLYAVILLGLVAWIWGRVARPHRPARAGGPGGARRAARRVRGLPPGLDRSGAATRTRRR